MPEPITMIAVGGGMVGLAGYMARRYYEIAKEIADVVYGVLAAVVFLPVVALCALIIKLSSRGPVFFTQTRAGKDGRPFKMYKVRTMHADAELDTGAVWAAEDDPRIIRACRWMRRSHLDELPQLINVIKGDMSLVGPRPERQEILDELREHYPNVDQRLVVRPGITGLAQIRNGYDSSVDSFRHKLEADLEYIENRSTGLELRILLATLPKFNDGKAN